MGRELIGKGEGNSGNDTQWNEKILKRMTTGREGEKLNKVSVRKERESGQWG